MAVPAELSSSRLAVHRSGGLFEAGSLQFGEFAAHDIDRSWTTSDRETFNEWSTAEAKQTFRFAFANAPAAAEEELPVRCATYAGEEDVDIGPATVKDKSLHMTCTMGTEGTKGRFLLDQVARATRTGTIDVQGVHLDVRSSRRLEKAAWDVKDPVGYELYLGNRVVGAVQTINGGAVWIAPDAPPEVRRGVAIAAAALLLFQDIGA